MWNVVRPAGPDYRCDIFEDEVQTSGNVGAIDGQLPPTPRTPAPSMDSREEQESEHSENTIESGQPGNTTEEEGLADLAESIHINLPKMATMTKEPRTEELIDDNTGHRIRCVVNIVDDEAALQSVTITPYLSRDTTYCYRHCKGISRFPLLLHHPSPRPMPDRTFPHH